MQCYSRYFQQVSGLSACQTFTLGYFGKTKQSIGHLSTNMLQYHHIYMPTKRLQKNYYRRHYHFRKTSVVLANTQRVLSLVEEGLLK